MADLLVVEDDLDAAEALGEILRMIGHDVRLAFNGEQGLKFVGERAPEAALLDIEMPVLDGPGMAAMMFVRDAGLEKVPIVLLSGVQDLAGVAARVGTPYFLCKPFTFEVLQKTLARVLVERTPPRPANLP
jgi:CheY-like chemotaxis protein